MTFDRVYNGAGNPEFPNTLEKPLERLLFACRWLLAPLSLGLSLALTVLAMIDLVLVGSLIVRASTSMPAR